VLISHIIWDHSPGGNVEHIDEHDLTPEDVAYVIDRATEIDVSKSTGRPCVFGYTPDDEFIIVIFEWIDDDTIVPVAAYEVPEP
jgi:hypothetical protein